ncbi:MAG TPA: TolC family protein [Vicinamibacterales bacterium]|jgi:outer membrane protein TolC|nr:TolC family protein [Vicinamibacterales bacterium]
MTLKLMTRIVVAAAAGAVLNGSAYAQVVSSATGELELTLEEAVRRAVDHNPDLAIVRLDTEIGAAQVAESRGAFVPVFSTVAARSSAVTPASSLLAGDRRSVSVDDWFSSAGVRQRLPWGSGTWGVTWDTARTATDSLFSSFDPSLQSGFQVAFSQPLLKDRAMDSARHQYVIAKQNQESSELQFRESAVQTVAAVKEAYWTLKAAMANVTVQQRSLDIAQELVRQNRVRVQAGEAAPIDLVQAEAEVAQRREALIRANATAGDAEDRVRRLIMDPADETFWRVRLNPVDEPVGPGLVPDVDAAVANALKSRYDLARARTDLATAATDVEYFTNQKLPDLRFETSYRGSGLGGTQLLRTGTFPGIVSGSQRTTLGDAVGQVLGGDYPAWSVGVTISYPLGQSYEEAGLVRSEIARRQAAHRVASLQLDAAESIRQAARQVQSTSERIGAARAGATFAEQRLDAEQRRYEVGLSTTFLVTQAQRDLVQAQVNLLQAMLDYQSSLVRFEALQQAPPRGGSTMAIGLNGSSIVWLPTPAPSGLFRQSAGGGGP